MPILSYVEYMDYLDDPFSEEELAILDSIYEKVDQELRKVVNPDQLDYTVVLESATYYDLSEKAKTAIVDAYAAKNWDAHVEVWQQTDPVAAKGINIYLVAP